MKIQVESALDMKRAYILQENGQVTLPMEWRERFGLKKGDLVVFEETDDGALVIKPRQALAMSLLDEIGAVLKQRGLSLDDMIEAGRDIRQEIYDEKYARDEDDA